MYVTVPNDEQVVDVIDLARTMHADSLYGHLPFDTDKLIEELAVALESPEQLLLVAVDDSKVREQIVGFFVAYWTEYFFNRERVAMDKALYVRAESRGKKAAKLLIQAYREWAYAEGCKEAVLADTAGHNAGPFFDRLCFKQVGTVHKLRLED